MEAVTDLVAAIATGIALAGAVLAYRRWGWRGVVGVVAVVVGAVLAALSRRRAPPGPPPSQSSSTVRRTAGDILRERSEGEQARRDEALGSDDPEGRLAELGRSRRRRP